MRTNNFALLCFGISLIFRIKLHFTTYSGSIRSKIFIVVPSSFLLVAARWFGDTSEVGPVCQLHKKSFYVLCLVFVNLRESCHNTDLNRLIRVPYIDIQLRSTSNVELIHRLLSLMVDLHHDGHLSSHYFRSLRGKRTIF
jgi:hypothetical protein